MIQYHVDQATTDLISGWAFSDQGDVTISLRIDGRPLSHRVYTRLPRPDVGAAYAAIPGAGSSGFTYPFHPEDFGAGPSSEALVEISLVDGAGATTGHTFPVMRPLPPREDVNTAPPRTPFPPAIVRLVQAMSAEPRFAQPEWSNETSLAAIDLLATLLRRGSKRLPELYSYVGYLERCWHHFHFVAKNFPPVNLTTSSNVNDLGCAGTEPLEMMSIAHYLYNLRARGIPGVLAEFGCFKGFSTSCLSYACAELAMDMQVFDSFAGLPPSASTFYKTGDFAGSFDEVRQNVGAFGRPDRVTFHRGYFSDSLQTWPRTPIACLWMDVDLDTSSRDVMTIFSQLDPQSALFSHECSVEHYRDPELAARPDPHNVIPPIMQAYAERGRTPTGCHVHNFTGAFWDARDGVPALPGTVVARLCEKLLARPC